MGSAKYLIAPGVNPRPAISQVELGSILTAFDFCCIHSLPLSCIKKVTILHILLHVTVVFYSCKPPECVFFKMLLPYNSFTRHCCMLSLCITIVIFTLRHWCPVLFLSLPYVTSPESSKLCCKTHSHGTSSSPLDTSPGKAALASHFRAH